jgi:hypothetical protein
MLGLPLELIRAQALVGRQILRVLGQHRRRVDDKVGVDLRAHGFADLDHDGNPGVRGAGRQEVGILDVLGADAERELPADVLAQARPLGERRVEQIEPQAAELHAGHAVLRDEGRLRHVHGG